MNTQRPLHTFTLIELLLVVAVIAILAGMLLPALNAAKEKARTIACASNQKQCSLELLLYAEDSQGTIPPYYYYCTTKWGKTDQKEGNWFVILADRPFLSEASKKKLPIPSVQA